MEKNERSRRLGVDDRGVLLEEADVLEEEADLVRRLDSFDAAMNETIISSLSPQQSTKDPPPPPPNNVNNPLNDPHRLRQSLPRASRNEANLDHPAARDESRSSDPTTAMREDRFSLERMRAKDAREMSVEDGGRGRGESFHHGDADDCEGEGGGGGRVLLPGCAEEAQFCAQKGR